MVFTDIFIINRAAQRTGIPSGEPHQRRLAAGLRNERPSLRTLSAIVYGGAAEQSSDAMITFHRHVIMRSSQLTSTNRREIIEKRKPH